MRRGAWLEEIFPEKEKIGPGRPVSHQYNIMNSLYIFLLSAAAGVTRAKGAQWASKSSNHRWLKIWCSDGTIDELKARILGAAQNEGLISWSSGAVDGFFSPGKKGDQGMPLSAFSAPANKDERKHVGELLETVEVKTGKAGRPRKKVNRLAADKGA